MIAFLKKYKAFIIGLVITRILTLILAAKKVILIDNDEVITNVMGFLFYWLLISILIHKLPYIRKQRKIAFKIALLLLFLTLIIVIDSTLKIPDNPFTIFALVAFYMGVIYTIIPTFFKKYRWLIIGIYIVSLSIFLYLRLFSGSFETYNEQKGEVFILLLFPIPLLFGLWVYEQRKWVKSLQAEKSKAELSLLKSQINPHFLFNTLNNLYGLTVEKSDKAPDVVLKLSDMLRYTIYNGKEDLVSLDNEVAYLKNYIELHKIRYHKNVSIDFNHQSNPEIKIAPLLYIILLENAFKHGVELLTKDAYININLTTNNEHVSFIIENNYNHSNTSKEKGIGLRNLKDRLALIYPHKHSLIIEENSSIFKVTLEINTK